MNDDLEDRLSGQLDRAAADVTGAGVSRDGVRQRVATRERTRRNRRRVVGALGAGLFVVLLVGTAVAVNGTRSSNTAGQPEDFGPFCAEARKIRDENQNAPAVTNEQQRSRNARQLDTLAQAAPGSTRTAVETMAALTRSAALVPSKEQANWAVTTVYARLSDTCHLGPDLFHSAAGTKVRPLSTCDSVDGSKLCLLGDGDIVHFEATGLEPGSTITTEPTAPGGLPRSPGYGTTGSADPPGPAAHRATVGSNGSYAPAEGFSREADDRVSVRVTFTPRDGEPQVSVLTT